MQNNNFFELREYTRQNNLSQNITDWGEYLFNLLFII